MEIKTQIIEDLEKARHQLIVQLGHMDKDREIFPGWRIKNFLDHITGWDELIINILLYHRSAKYLGRITGIDQHNAESIRNRESLTYEESLRDFGEIREKLKTIILETPNDLYKNIIDFPWGGTGIIQELISIFSHHELEHAQEIMDFLGK